MEGRMRARKAAGAGAAVALLLFMSLSPPPAAAKVSESGSLIDLITVENGTTDGFGGGNQLVVRVGNQAFGVVYGNERLGEGYVTFYAAVVRTIGVADVYEASSGRLVRSNVPIPIVTVVAQRMLMLAEFRDMNLRDGSPGDGIFNFRPNLSTPEIVDFNASEPLLKTLLLRGTWQLTGFELSAVGPDAVALDYTLTLSNMNYSRTANEEWSGDGHVDAVSFHVHLDIARRVEALKLIPHYDATVKATREGRELSTITPSGTTNASGTITKGMLKVDHEVVGWDPAPPLRDSHSRLLLITAIPVLNGIPDAVAPWVNQIALGGDRAGTARAELPENQSVVIKEGSNSTDTFARATSLELRDNWRRVASMRFDPTVQVWPREVSDVPENGTAYFQVLGGTPVAERFGEGVFRGFLMIGGYSYPAGYRVYHDPEVIAEGVELEGDSVLPAIIPALVMGAQFALTALALAGTALLSIYYASSRSRARVRADQARLAALKERYQLPPRGDGR